MSINLNRVFREGSKARAIAEMLLDGEPHTRTELAESVYVSPTTVPRVVSLLVNNGVKVETTMYGKAVTYRVTDDPQQPSQTNLDPGRIVAEYVPKGDPISARITTIEVDGPYLMVEFEQNNSETVRGRLLGEELPHGMFSSDAVVKAFVFFQHGQSGVRISKGRDSAVVTDLKVIGRMRKQRPVRKAVVHKPVPKKVIKKRNAQAGPQN